MQAQYDLVITGGTVIDPSQGLHAERDVAVKDGKIAAVGVNLVAEAVSTLDARGKLVTPGIVDLHVHVFTRISHYGVDADEHCLLKGVTTVLDTGSSGAQTFPGFREYVIEPAQTRIFALLNISSQGMINEVVGELEDMRNIDVAQSLKVLEANRDVILGMKIRLGRKMVGANAMKALKSTREVAEAVGVPIMVHIGDTVDPLADYVSILRPGDVVTHCFHGSSYGVLDADGNVVPEVRAAVERGVMLDIGHGRGSFSFDVCQKAMSQGLIPSTISSDIHSHNLDGPVFDQLTTMSKFLHLGFSLDEVIRMTTCAPAAAMGMPDGIGTLSVGAVADVSVLELRDGAFELMDSTGAVQTSDRRLVPQAIVRAGQPHAAVVDYQ